MKPFLQEVAEDILNNYANILDECCMIVPNKRTSIFFQKYFAEVAGKTIWAPDVYTIQAYIQQLSGITLADNLTLILDLYHVFREIEKPEQQIKPTFEGFDSFYFLGEILLSDFNELDKYMVDVPQVFTNIRDLEEINLAFEYFTDEQKEFIRNFWSSFKADADSEEKRRFLAVWKKMPAVHKKLGEWLLEKRYGYEGLVYKQLALMAKANQLNIGYKHLMFVGFNAVTRSQEVLFNYLQQNNISRFYWDADTYYINSPNQEAGFFLRENLRKFPDARQGYTVPSNLRNASKKIEVIGVPMSVGQAKSLPVLLEKLLDKNHPEKTAIVLTDEHLLFPVLHSLPQEVDNVNVTMGFPFTETSLYHFTIAFLHYQRKYKGRDASSMKAYHVDVLRLVKQSVIWNYDPIFAPELYKNISKDNRIYIPVAELVQANELYELIFTPVTDAEQLITVLLNSLFLLFNKNEFTRKQGVNLTLESEYIYHLYVQLKRLRESVNQKTDRFGTEAMSMEVLIKLIKQMLFNLRIPFSGEPLKGLQVIGMLETRNLDFENIILLSLNEGTFPKTNRPPSFITESLRYAHGMPVVKYQDSIAAYSFYRLIQRANTVTLLYNNISASGMGGEQSRFLRQLKYEYPHPIAWKIMEQELAQVKQHEIIVNKTPEVMQLLQAYILNPENTYQKRFSASAINMYIDCRLKFYLMHIAGLYEPEQVEEDVTLPLFGTMLHEVMEKLYADKILQNQTAVITATDINSLYPQISDYTQRAFVNQFAPGSSAYKLKGNDRIIKDVIEEYARTVLDYDKTIAPFEIISLEEARDHTAKVSVTINGTTQEAGIKGIIDRVDKLGDVYRVIDYKTGHADKAYKNFEQVFEREQNDRKRAILQTFQYSMLFRAKAGTEVAVVPAVYDIRGMRSPDFSPYLIQDKQTVTADMLPELLGLFETELSVVLSELFDSNVPFDQTPNDHLCQYCPYSGICMR